MSKRKFAVSLYVDAVLEVEEEVINRVNEEWRSTFYNLRNVEDIVAHIAINLLRGWDFRTLDGWADLPDEKVKLSGVEWDVHEIQELE